MENLNTLQEKYLDSSLNELTSDITKREKHAEELENQLTEVKNQLNFLHMLSQKISEADKRPQPEMERV